MTEQDAAKTLIEIALAQGLNVGVYDGEEWVLRKSTDLDAICAAMFTTDEDTLSFHKADGSKGGGWMQLVYGNSPAELVADYAANADMDQLWSVWHALVDV